MLASRLLGWRTICAVEIDPYCQQRLLDRQRDKCLPRFPVWDDVCTFDGHPWRGRVDVISGGFPCQDISAAGQGAGITGSRSGLIFEMLRIVDEVRPTFVFAENSPQLRTKGLATIVERFISMGYVGRVGVLGAGDIGANHERKRMWIVAVSKGLICGQGRAGRPATGAQRQQQLPFLCESADAKSKQVGAGGQPRECGWMGGSIGNAANSNSEAVREQPRRVRGAGRKGSAIAGVTDWWRLPRFAGVDDGLAHRMDRVRATGNGQVPGVAALVWSVLTSDLTAVNPSGTV